MKRSGVFVGLVTKPAPQSQIYVSARQAEAVGCPVQRLWALVLAGHRSVPPDCRKRAARRRVPPSPPDLGLAQNHVLDLDSTTAVEKFRRG